MSHFYGTLQGQRGQATRCPCNPREVGGRVSRRVRRLEVT